MSTPQSEFEQASIAAENSLQNFYLAQRLATEDKQAEAQKCLESVSGIYKQHQRTLYQYREQLSKASDNTVEITTCNVVEDIDSVPWSLSSDLES